MVKRQKTHEQKAASVKHFNVEKLSRMYIACREKNELVRERSRIQNRHDPVGAQPIYSEIAYVHQIFYCGLPTVGAKDEALTSLDKDNALDPDLVSTRILKKCAGGLGTIPAYGALTILKF